MTGGWSGSAAGHGRYLVRHHDAIASRCLGPVQGGVGGLQHRLSARAVIGKDRDAHGQGDATHAPPIALDLKVLHPRHIFSARSSIVAGEACAMTSANSSPP